MDGGGAVGTRGRDPRATANSSTRLPASAGLRAREVGHTSDRLAAAVALHRAGRLDEAERAYRALLEESPDDADLLQRLGVVAAQVGRLQEAEALLADSLKHAPDNAEAHNNLGNLRQLQHRFDEAAECHRRAVELNPASVSAQFNLGVALGSAGRLDEAAASYLQCLALDPALAAANHNLGLIRKRQGRFDDAAASLERAVELTPDDAAAHENLGAVFRDQRRLPEAAAAFQRALDLDPSRRRLGHLIAAYTGRATDAAPDYYVADLFDGVAEDFDDHLVNALGYRTPATLTRLLSASLGDRRFGRVLDLGCGTGLAGVELAPTAAELWGVDLSHKMLDQARARGLYHRLEAMSIEEFLEGENAVFDLVVAADVLVYVGNIARCFALVRRRSRPGAYFVFSTEIAEAGDFVLYPTGRYGHARGYVERVASETGFTVIRAAQEPLRMENGLDVMGNCFLLQAG